MSVEEIFGLLLLPLSYGFMVRGLLAALIVGLICAVVGTFVVVRGMAFIGGELSHAVLPGVAVAYLSGGNIFFGALAAAVASALKRTRSSSGTGGGAGAFAIAAGRSPARAGTTRSASARSTAVHTLVMLHLRERFGRGRHRYSDFGRRHAPGRIERRVRDHFDVMRSR